jgi:regulator of protease activity HflC (stomatin/prohibitin superfamily)
MTLSIEHMNIHSKKINFREKVSFDIDVYVCYKITNPEISVFAINDIKCLVNQVCQMAVSNVVSEFSLAQLLSHTNDFDLQIKNIINGSIQAWGAEVTVVEINDVPRPKNIKRPEIKKIMKGELALAEAEFQLSLIHI